MFLQNRCLAKELYNFYSNKIIAVPRIICRSNYYSLQHDSFPVSSLTIVTNMAITEGKQPVAWTDSVWSTGAGAPL